MNKLIISTLKLGLSAVLIAGSANAATITQTSAGASGTDWNNATVWGGTAPTAGNDYVTATGNVANTTTSLNYSGGVTGRVRETGTVFGGDSITISSGTELFMTNVDGTTSDGNVILDGGMVRWSPLSGGNTTMTGTLHIEQPSVLGSSQGEVTVMIISSTLTGSADLRVAAGASNSTIRFAGDLSDYSGTFNMGGGDWGATLDLAGNYYLPNLGLSLGDPVSRDRLNITHDISVASLSFGGNQIPAGTYTATELNDLALVDDTNRFFGDSSLTVIPEPGTYALIGGLLALALVVSRRARRTA